MSLQYDPETSKIIYDGKVVGHVENNNNTNKVKLSIEYECEGGEWITPIAWFAKGLTFLPQHNRRSGDLDITSNAESVIEVEGALRFLIEKTIKGGGYVWTFHKSDPDNWPSPLHGHDYENHVKLDALTGKVFDVGTKAHCGTMKKRDLQELQTTLRDSKDFRQKLFDLQSQGPKPD